MVLFLLQHYFKKRHQEEEKRDAQRHKRDVLVIKSITALGDLTVANSIALRDGKTNGEMKKALHDYDEVNKEMLDFLIENSDKGE
ncbi:MAG: hypothetical protein IKB70_11150, partial [Bacilli bacterium]|nr:hypothetical protein [Bacilli bacterium]